MTLVSAVKRFRDLWMKHVVWHRHQIGKNFHCGRGVFMWARDGIEIGDDFYIG